MISVLSLTLNQSRSVLGKGPGSRLVLFGARHANRNPEQFFASVGREWGGDGEMHLNQIGREQSTRLGAAFKSWMGASPLTGSFYSSSATRCVHTMQGVLSSLVPNTPITVDDPMLRMYSLTDCPANDRAWSPILSDSLPSLAPLASRSALLRFLSAHTGWSPSVSHAADAADNIQQMELFSEKAPTWLLEARLQGYDRERLRRELLEYSEAHQIACANYEPCRDLMAGVWIAHIIDSIQAAVDNPSTSFETHIVGYVSHTEVTLSLMKILGYIIDELSPSAGFIIELKLEPQPMIRLLEHSPVDTVDRVIYQPSLSPPVFSLLTEDLFLPWSDYRPIIDPFAIRDWKAACNA